MSLLRKKDGSYSLRKDADLRGALDRREENEEEVKRLQAEIEGTRLGQRLAQLEDDSSSLSAAINQYALDNNDYEDDDWKVTKVVSHKRSWDVDKLESLVPRGVFKNMIQVQVVPAKVDQMIRSKKVSLDDIEDAYVEVANSPYVKVTRRSSREDGASEADALAAKLA